MRALTARSAMLILFLIAAGLGILVFVRNQGRKKDLSVKSREEVPPAWVADQEEARKVQVRPTSPQNPPVPGVSPIAINPNRETAIPASYLEFRQKNRLRIAQLQDQYFSQPGKLRELPLKEWKQLIEDLHHELSPKERKGWGEKFQAAFGTPLPSTADDLLAFQGVLDHLDQGLAAALLGGWFGPSGLWGQASLDLLVPFLAKASAYDLTTLLGGKQIVTEEILEAVEKRLSAAPSQLGPEIYLNLAFAWNEKGKSLKAREWLKGAIRAAQAHGKVPLETLSGICARAGEYGLPATEGVALIPLVISYIREGALDGTYAKTAALSWAFSSEGQTKPLEDLLTEESGQPRLGVAKILAMARRNGGGWEEWVRSLNHRLDQGQTEKKAAWLLVKGFSDSLAFRERVGEQFQRLHGLRVAEAAVLTDAERMTVAAEWVAYFRDGKTPELGLGALERIKAGGGGQIRAEIEKMEGALKEEVRRNQIEMGREGWRAEEGRRAVRREYLIKCAERAKAQGDQEEVRKIEAALAENNSNDGG